MQGGRKEHRDKETKEIPWKHEKRSEDVEYRNDYSRSNEIQWQHLGRRFNFRRDTVTYGNANGEYCTWSTTRMTGSDGVTFGERKEADTATWQAKHRISSERHNKDHSMESKLNSDGKVDTLPPLPNLNEGEDEADELEEADELDEAEESEADELAGFEESEADELSGFEESEYDELSGFEESWSGDDMPGWA